jgi:hypothetical protein
LRASLRPPLKLRAIHFLWKFTSTILSDHFARGIKLRAETSRSRRASEITDILAAVVAGKVRDIAIAREVGDSVLCRSLPGLGSPVSGSLAGDGDHSLKWIARAKCAQ